MVDDAYKNINEYCAAHPDVFNHAINVLESCPDLKSFDSTFVEVSKVLVEGVNLLGELHPFVKGMSSPFLSRERLIKGSLASGGVASQANPHLRSHAAPKQQKGDGGQDADT
jgi:hypothetical protein